MMYNAGAAVLYETDDGVFKRGTLVGFTVHRAEIDIGVDKCERIEVDADDVYLLRVAKLIQTNSTTPDLNVAWMQDAKGRLSECYEELSNRQDAGENVLVCWDKEYADECAKSS